ncbi:MULTISPECIES: CPBP family intramembrane glutamic endopeptidase [Methanobacterium]|jgi:membrane protease YdiL (CAAX protease family)|uniref:CPBP family intramembrane metalloprotease n=1 Tax=Methanobacterium formicicum TaxID=2162 RepID=A0A843AQM2_METFO|nr:MULTISPECIES: CPBP family intramembrane glutamic endopeptidase [Methanobacterium]KUK75743.1 MAG: Abortive infection protein [Methanobacterium sp. 42_16]MBF4476108.1 CPBP family intramembrane metalloprotease [Methanobacterium formicicum]
MKLFNSYKDRNDFLKLVLKIVVALALIQLFRAAIFGSLWITIQPGDNITLFQFINGLHFIIVGIILLLYFKPSLDELGLQWDDIRRRTRLFYIIGALILVTLIVIPYTFGWELQILVMGLMFGLITPLFEELLFRGYIWGKISQSPGMVHSPTLTLGTVTLLFMVWHLGYLDVLILHPLASTNIPWIMVSKMGIGLVLGLIVGYLRLKTGKTYASILFHGLWNVFAP